MKRGGNAISFLKWAGSKRQVLPAIVSLVPSKINTYREPMVGSGTLFFTMRPRRAALSDLNEELVNCFRVVRDRLPALLLRLGAHKNDEQHYLEVRAQDPKELGPVDRAARTIYLNKTCYNGLYRVNSRGQFNVPFGRITWANICDEPTLRRASEALRSADLEQGDFQEQLQHAEAGDLVYLDPPYLSRGPGTKTFQEYLSGFFTEEDHRRLASTFRELDRRGCHVLLSNSDVPLVRELYEGYTIEVLAVTRRINRRAREREGWREVLVHNLKRPGSRAARGDQLGMWHE